MARDWQELTKVTGGAPIVVERVSLPESEVSLEGEFDLPPLARLSAEDQVFVMAFVRSHGSIKEMERLFGISYPTVKNRLNRLAEQFPFVEKVPPPSGDDALGQLAKGEITAEEAIRRLEQ